MVPNATHCIHYSLILDATPNSKMHWSKLLHTIKTTSQKAPTTTNKLWIHQCKPPKSTERTERNQTMRWQSLHRISGCTTHHRQTNGRQIQTTLNFSSPSGQTQLKMLCGSKISTKTQISRRIDPLTHPRHNQPQEMPDHKWRTKHQNALTQSLPKTLRYGTRHMAHHSRQHHYPNSRNMTASHHSQRK